MSLLDLVAREEAVDGSTEADVEVTLRTRSGADGSLPYEKVP